MSGKLMGLVYKLDLPRAEREVLLAMADNANDDGGNCFPGVDLLAWKLDCSVRKIQYTLRSLEIKGAISVTNNKTGGRGKHPEYQLNLSVIPLKGAKTNKKQTPKGCKNQHEKGAISDIEESERVQFPTQKGAKTSIAYKEETPVETPKKKSSNEDAEKKPSAENLEFFKRRDGLLKFLKEKLGGKPLGDAGKQKAHALWLVKNYTDEQIFAEFERQWGQSKREKVDWSTVRVQIAQSIARQKPALPTVPGFEVKAYNPPPELVYALAAYNRRQSEVGH